MGEERTLFSLCSISFQCDTQVTVKANSPNESGCAVAAPCVSSSAPQQGQCQGNGEQDMSHIPAAPSRRLQWSWAHCTLCCVYTTSKGSEVMLPDSGVPGTQRKLFSSFRWCLDGRTSLEYLMSLGSDVPTLRDQHVLRRCKSSSLKEFHPQSWASKLQPFGASLIPLTSVLAPASPGPCWALEHLHKASISLLTREL